MVAHDENIGRMLAKLDELGIADDTIVMYSTDNGPHYNSWPDAGITPFRSEKNTNWEGGWRVPIFVRWPGKIKPGTVLNDIASHQDWLPTLLAAAGEPDIAAKLLEGHTAGDKTFKVHIDGYNLLPYLTGEATGEPQEVLLLHQRRRRHPGDPHGRLESRAHGAAGQAADVLVRAVREAAGAEDVQPAPRSVRAGGRELEHLLGLGDLPRLHHLRDAGDRGRSRSRPSCKFPPRQKPAAFNLDEVLRHLQEATSSANRWAGGPFQRRSCYRQGSSATLPADPAEAYSHCPDFACCPLGSLRACGPVRANRSWRAGKP